MKKQPGTLIIFILFTLFCGIGTQDPAFAVQDTIVAIVNDDIITFKDLNTYMKAAYLHLKLSGMPAEHIKASMEDIEKQGIQKLIEDRIILSHANKLGMEIREKAVEEQLSEIKGNYPSEEKFLNTLLADGYTVTDLKDKIREEMKVKFLIDKEIRSKIFVTPQDITDFYEQNIKLFKIQESVDLNSIFIAKTTKNAKTRSREAFTSLKNGESFSEVFKKYADAPPIGKIVKGQLLPDIEDVIFKMDIGKISEIVETEVGFYIFKVKTKLPPKTGSLEEATDNIKRQLFQKKFKEKYIAWVTKLKKDAFIEIKM